MPSRRFAALEEPRRRALLRAASQEFGERGFAGATFERIAERAETSKGTLFYYFEDKADLYATVVRDVMERFLSHVGMPRPAADPAAFWAEVRRLCRNGMAFYEVDPDVAGIIRSLARDGAPVADLQGIRSLYAAWLDALLEAGQRLGAIRTDLPRGLMIGAAQGLSEGIDLWLAEHGTALDPEARDRLADTLADMYRRVGSP